jgi:predicted ferric reductase
MFSTGVEEALGFIYRLAGLFGLTSLFIAIISSSFIKQISKIFETTYIRWHHYFSILGLILITLHPIAMAIDFGDLTIFIPDFSSWTAFWELAGRPALYIAYVASLGVLLRKSIQKYWRYVHGLIYVTFIFGAVHGLLIGDDLANPFLYVVYIIMLVVVVLNFIYKRYLKYKISKRRKKS